MQTPRDDISSNEKIKKALEVEKMSVDACRGVQRTLDSFKYTYSLSDSVIHAICRYMI